MFPVHQACPKYLARHSERGKKTWQKEKEVGRQFTIKGIDRPGVRQVPEGSGEQGKMENTGLEIICGAPTTLSVKGLMMMRGSPALPFLLCVCFFVLFFFCLPSSRLPFFALFHYTSLPLCPFHSFSLLPLFQSLSSSVTLCLHFPTLTVALLSLVHH